jgi:LacI family transcriptional regulator
VDSKEIAKIAGVSRSTVSRVINNYSNVPIETRKKVLEAIEKYNYVPYSSARILAGKSNKIIGLFITDAKFDSNDNSVFTSSYYSLFTSIVIDTARRFDYNVLISSVREEKDFLNIRDLFYNKTIAGGIFIGGKNSESNIINIIKNDCRVALVGLDPIENKNSCKNCFIVNADNFKGAYRATEYLIDLGHKSIAHISGFMDQLSSIDRLRGYKKALSDYRIPIIDELIVQGEFTEISGYEQTDKLLRKEKITAIFAGNDNMAIGCMHAIEDHKLKVPQDISVIGFDDIEIARYIKPSLTSVNLSLYEMGEIAASKLIESIEEDSILDTRFTVPVELIIRKSCQRLIKKSK